MKTIRIILLVLIIIGIGLLCTQNIWVPKLVNKILASEGVPLDLSADYKNATYSVEGQPVMLVNGFAQSVVVPGSASKIVTRYFGNDAIGDLNGDGLNDVAFILTQNSSGSGTFYYAVVALRTTNGYVGTNAVFLGDRITPQTTEIKNGQLVVNYADRKQGESMSVQPSVGVSKYFKISNGVLVVAE